MVEPFVAATLADRRDNWQAAEEIFRDRVSRPLANLLALYPASWPFATVDGVGPTNNHAERILRGGVLWRKNALGCQGAEGCRFVELMLTVAQTPRLQDRPVLDDLYRAIVVLRSGLTSATTGPGRGLNGHP